MSYNPVKHPKNWKQSILKDPMMRAEYEAFALQLDLALKLKRARQQAHLTQEKVAERMATQKPAVARLESGGGSGKHLPSLLTLVKYAHAVGYRLELKLIPESRASRAA
jgi:DNA-binding XRE family transcriptional regulator